MTVATKNVLKQLLFLCPSCLLLSFTPTSLATVRAHLQALVIMELRGFWKTDTIYILMAPRQQGNLLLNPCCSYIAFLFLEYSFEISCKMILTRGLELKTQGLSLHFHDAPVQHLQPPATRNFYLLGNFTDAIKDYIAIRDKMRPGAFTENPYSH